MTNTKGNLSSLRAAVAAGLVLLTGCSVLFEAANVDGGDGSEIDGGGSDIDADLAACAYRVGGTIGHFTLDGQGDNTTVTNIASAATADSVKEDQGVLVAAGLNVEVRDTTECGHAATIDGLDGTLIRIDHDTFPNVVSVDFWFRVDSIVDSNGLGGLLVKDGDGNAAGDMGIYIFQSENADALHHLLLRLQDGTDIYFGCSYAVALSVWNHVAVSFDGNLGVKFFVNGVLADNTSADVPDSGNLGSEACGAGVSVKTVTPNSSTRSWLWGASNNESPENFASHPITGAIDELRFRDEAFTEQEAFNVHRRLTR